MSDRESLGSAQSRQARSGIELEAFWKGFVRQGDRLEM